MIAYDFVHLAFLALGGEIQGKTKLQKTIYFLGLMTGHEDGLGYRPHYYGPYSDEVASAVERLKTLGFLDLSVSGMGSVDSRGFEVARHDYRLNEAGVKLANAKKERFSVEWEEIRNGAKALKRLLEKDYIELSIAAKTWFMLGKTKGNASGAELANLSLKFDWSVSLQQIQSAAKALEDVGLVTLT